VSAALTLSSRVLCTVAVVRALAGKKAGEDKKLSKKLEARLEELGKSPGATFFAFEVQLLPHRMFRPVS
jgi:hypothetical protein